MLLWLMNHLPTVVLVLVLLMFKSVVVALPSSNCPACAHVLTPTSVGQRALTTYQRRIDREIYMTNSKDKDPLATFGTTPNPKKTGFGRPLCGPFDPATGSGSWGKRSVGMGRSAAPNGWKLASQAVPSAGANLEEGNPY